MEFKKHIKIWGLATVIVFASGCEDFLDINVDPNNPAEVTVSQLLTAGEIAMVNSFGIGNPGLSTPASILVHQTVQRGSVDSYNVSGEDFQIQTAWQNLYSGALQDFKVIIDQGTEEGNLQYAGIARILTAYSYSMWWTCGVIFLFRKRFRVVKTGFPFMMMMPRSIRSSLP